MISHAVETTVAEIHREHGALAQVRAELARLIAVTEDGYRRAETLALNPDLDDGGLRLGALVFVPPGGRNAGTVCESLRAEATAREEPPPRR
jgi:hypothetical protein